MNWFHRTILGLGDLERKEDKILAALEDLQTAVTRLNSSVSAELKAIADKLAGTGDSVSAADVESAVAGINAVAGKLDAETAALAPPAPTPAPAPNPPAA